MKHRRTCIRLLILLALSLGTVFPVAMRQSVPAQAADSGGPVVTEAVPVPLLPVERELFSGPELGDNLIAAGNFINANDLCAVYAVDIDPGANHHVEVFYLEECFGQEGER